MLAVAMLCSYVGAVAPLDPATAEELWVWLDGHKGALDLSGDAPVLRFNALAHSRLPVKIEAIEVGVLFAGSGDELASIEPGALYDHEPAEGSRAVGAVRVWVETDLGPGGEQAVLVESPLSPEDPEPVSWLTHVLGYRLADVNVPMLRTLVGSEVFADEVAVVETLALAGDLARKRAVRERWGGREDLIANLAELARAPGKEQPDLQATIERVMAIRALGVLGGETAAVTLGAMMKDPSLATPSESLLVMSIARLRGSPLEAPMAQALPPEARRLTDVVAAALDDVAGWADPLMTVEPAVEPAPAPQDEDAFPLWFVAFVAVGLVVSLLAVAAARLRAR